jgi:hypothetical protein
LICTKTNPYEVKFNLYAANLEDRNEDLSTGPFARIYYLWIRVAFIKHASLVCGRINALAENGLDRLHSAQRRGLLCKKESRIEIQLRLKSNIL